MKTLTPELENTSTPDWNVQTRPIHGTSLTPDSLRRMLLLGAKCLAAHSINGSLVAPARLQDKEQLIYSKL